MARDDIIEALAQVGAHIQGDEAVEILLIGGAAGMIIGELPDQRTTLDCDVIDFVPADAQDKVEKAARQVAREMGLPEGWLSSQARQLNILPDGWRQRRVHIGTFGRLHVYAIGRQDLLATKCYANRPQDREDIHAMRPRADELALVRTYLNMLRVPSREANLDQVDAALRLVTALEQEAKSE